jgi:hypothetical protein
MFQAIKRFSLAPLYAIFAPADGFAEFVVVVCLAASITLAALGKLTDSFAGCLTAIGGFGVIHDNCTVWLARRLERVEKPPVVAPSNPPAAQ